MTLYELIGRSVRENYPKYGDLKFLNSDNDSAQFINEIVRLDGVEIPTNSDKKTNYIAETRARHSVVSYLLGLLINDFCRFDSIIFDAFEDEFFGVNAKSLWKYTALEHDYGYFIQPQKNTPISPDEELKKQRWCLLTDEQQEGLSFDCSRFERKPVMAFYYSEILSYFRMRFDVHKDDEVLDHGIWGAVKLYNRKMHRTVSREIHNKTKIVCLTIAQHNIFKSQTIRDDKLYQKYNLSRFKKDTPFRIERDTPLLLFLGLIDTLECVKKFCKSASENGGKYIRTETLLKKIEFSADPASRTITWNTTELRNYIKREKDDSLLKSYNKYIRGVMALPEWTVFEVEKKNNILIISY